MAGHRRRKSHHRRGRKHSRRGRRDAWSVGRSVSRALRSPRKSRAVHVKGYKVGAYSRKRPKKSKRDMMMLDRSRRRRGRKKSSSRRRSHRW